MIEFCPHCGKEIKTDEPKLVAEAKFKTWPNTAGNNAEVNFNLDYKCNVGAANPVIYEFKLKDKNGGGI